MIRSREAMRYQTSINVLLCLQRRNEYKAESLNGNGCSKREIITTVAGYIGNLGI
jgi:hypothetical protein